MKVKSESEVAQSRPTLSDPMDGSPPGSSVHGILQVRVPEWGAIALSVKKPQSYAKSYSKTTGHMGKHSTKGEILKISVPL